MCAELQVVIDQPAGQPPEKGQREEFMLASLNFLICLLPDWERCWFTKLQITFARQFFQQGKFRSRRHSCQDRFHSRRDGVSQKGFCQRHWSSKFFLARISILSDGERTTQHKISFILTNACYGLQELFVTVFNEANFTVVDTVAKTDFIVVETVCPRKVFARESGAPSFSWPGYLSCLMVNGQRNIKSVLS